MRTGSVVVLLALVLSGCATEDQGPGDQPPAVDPSLDEQPVPAGIMRPQWSVGDWWEYEVTIKRDFGGVTWSLVVTPTVIVTNTRPAYETSLAERSDAVTARYWQDVWGVHYDLDLNPLVPIIEAGELRRTTFGMYRWPLETKSTWAMSAEVFYGGTPAAGTLTYTVLAVDNATAAGQDSRVAHVTGSGTFGTLDSAGNDKNEVFNVTYTFAEAAKTVSSLSIQNETLETVRIELQRFGTNYTGPVIDWQVDPVYERFRGIFPGSTSPELAPAPETFGVDGEYTFLASLVGLGVFTPGRAGLTLIDPAGAQKQYSRDSVGTSFEMPEQLPLAGEWKVSYEIAGIGFSLLIVDAITEAVVDYQDGQPVP